MLSPKEVSSRIRRTFEERASAFAALVRAGAPMWLVDVLADDRGTIDLGALDMIRDDFPSLADLCDDLEAAQLAAEEAIRDARALD